jgi:hypothetical protein
MSDRVLALLIAIPVLLGSAVATAAEPERATEVRIAYDATRHPAVVVTPRSATLGLDDSGYLRFQLEPSAAEVAARFTVRFVNGTPFDHHERSAAAGEHCLFGPLATQDGVGTYAFEVQLEDAGGRVVDGGVPRLYLLLAVLVGFLFLIFNYIEKPLTRTYESAAH